MGWSFPLWQRESWRVFWHQRAVVVPLALAVAALTGTWVLVMTMSRPLADVLVLRYSIYVGINWLAEPYYIFLLPVLATLMVGVNVALAYTLARRTVVLRYLWMWTATLVALGWAWLAWLLVSFNT